MIAGESSTRMAGRGGTSTSTFGATRKPDAREDFGNVGQSYTRTPMGMSSATAGKQRTGPLCGAWGEAHSHCHPIVCLLDGQRDDRRTLGRMLSVPTGGWDTRDRCDVRS